MTDRTPTVVIVILALTCLLPVPTAARAEASSPFDPSGTPGGRPSDAELREEISEFARHALDILGVPPGMAVAVVREDRVVLSEGFGLRDVEAGLPAEDDTPFYIASSTKPFVALLAAILDHRGDLDLDASLSRLLPGAPLPPDHPVTLRQLLTHTSGLVNQPIVIRTAYTGDYDREVLLELLSATRTGARTFDYTNLGYVLTGLVIDGLVHGSWKDTLRRELLEPLGMERTTASVDRVRAEGWPLAAAYDDSPEGSERIPFVKVDATMHPAGGLISTARDLARWLRFQLGEGRLDGRQIVPAEVVRATHRPQTAVDQDFFLFHRHGYALGWYVSDYEGDTLLHHFGGFEGFRAHVSFMPERDVGVVALINETGHGFFVPDLVAAYAYDLLAGKKDLESRYRERMAEMTAGITERKEALAEHRRERSRRTFDLSRPMTAYAGTYRSDLLGEARILPDGDGLRIVVGVLESPIEPFSEPETVRAELPPGSGTVLGFRVDADAGVTGFEALGVFFRRVGGIEPSTKETGGRSDE